MEIFIIKKSINRLKETRTRLLKRQARQKWTILVRAYWEEGKGEKASWSISRVLSRTIIHLRPVSPPACSDLPESTAGRS